MPTTQSTIVYLDPEELDEKVDTVPIYLLAETETIRQIYGQQVVECYLSAQSPFYSSAYNPVNEYGSNKDAYSATGARSIRSSQQLAPRPTPILTKSDERR